VRLRARKREPFRVTDVAERLASYDVPQLDDISSPDTVDDEAVERAATLLSVMPGGQRRETIEKLVSPNDEIRGRAAVDALIEAAFATEDSTGHLRRVA
jgi:hypothetical protein